MVSARLDRLPILFLWHHHQPFYHAPEAERPVMPWVRLHAVRGYVDMLTVARETGAAMTFNFTPALLEQLAFASDNDPADEFERISRIPARDLTEEEKKFLLMNFFSINWSVHVKGNARYESLLTKCGDHVSESSFRAALTDFSAQDYTDLIALFNLAWIGFTGRKDAVIVGLMNKKRDYSSEDIQFILEYHHQVLGSILKDYRDLKEKGRIEISTSPFSHAILPLLFDSFSATPDIARHLLPRPEYRHPEDVDRQLKMAVNKHREVWGDVPQGLWPSEGSVSEEVLQRAEAAGFRWLATDQGILERSERTRTDTTAHFVSYQYKAKSAGIRIYFRDRALADAIGFRYASMPPEESVNEFVTHLERIEEGTRGVGGRCVVIALDGENPWESYTDGGEKLLLTLFQKLESHPRLIPQTFSEHMRTGSRERITRLHAGSWIDSNFRIWIGDPQKNQAWIELGRARRILDDLNVGDSRREACWSWLLRAQGSDWFWWYGEPFSSAYKHHFDLLFRSFLKAAYAEAGRQAPPGLDLPIAQPIKPERRLQPAYPITPTIDGRDTSFYEWVGACRIDPRQFGTTMGRAEHSLKCVNYGFGDSELFFRIEPAQTLHPQTTAILRLHVLGQDQITLEIPFNGQSMPVTQNGIRWVSDETIEIAIRHDHGGVPRGGECQFWVEMTDENILLEKLPPAGAFHFILPTSETVAANWMV
ncbi:hypothetical protein EHM69_09010 [candidate division KSB1 bacterium]|nr:MAG: hypothetical protein EHM69_09010 [candidate division KSB1 bacterium]